MIGSMRQTITALAFLALSCGGANTKDVETANGSRYDTEFGTLFEAIRDYTLSTYCNLSLQSCNTKIDADARSGAIHTTWIQIHIATAPPEQEPERARGRNMAPTAGDPRTPLVQYFIRFDIAVIGPRPYRISVAGHAAKLTRGDALLVELKAGDEPSWLGPRTDSFVVAIHDRLEKYAVSSVKASAVSQPATTATVDAGVPLD